MTIKVAINGYGRIGRNILRAHYECGKKHDLEFVALNDLGNAETNAHMVDINAALGFAVHQIWGEFEKRLSEPGDER